MQAVLVLLEELGAIEIELKWDFWESEAEDQLEVRLPEEVLQEANQLGKHWKYSQQAVMNPDLFGENGRLFHLSS